MTPAEHAAEIAELPPLAQYRAIEKLVERQEALLAGIESIKRKSDPGVDIDRLRPPTDERGERLNAIFLIARALLAAPQPVEP